MGASNNRFVSGDVRPVHAEMRAAADGKNTWIVGGGDLAGQRYDAGLLDELIVQIGSATLGKGKPLLPRRVPGSILRLHSTTDLTMNTYTDPRLLDVGGAISSLPSLPLSAGSQEATIAVSRYGTVDSPASKFAPKFAPQSGKRCESASISGNPAENSNQRDDDSTIAVSACPVNENAR